MNQVMITSLLKFALRRGLSMIGAAGAAVSDEWVAQTASLLLIAGNELWNWYQSHKAEQAKAETVTLS
jgi:hypothetical protein